MGKPIPRYWWDFKYDGQPDPQRVIVESDDDRFPVVASFPIMGEYADSEIERALKTIADLEAGRLDPRRLAASSGL